MEWKLLTQADQVTTTWSGGTTTQLAIAPEGAVYADRDFLVAAELRQGGAGAL